MIRFNFLRELLDESGERKGTIYLKSEGSDKKIETIRIEDFNPSDFVGIEKEKLPWIQMFDSGYRISQVAAYMPDVEEKMSHWNGCVMVDLDSKNYKGRFADEFNLNFGVIASELTWNLSVYCKDNFYFSQVSASGNSLHLVFYFDVPKTVQNFKKCSKAAVEMVTSEITRGTFISKEAGYDIINCPRVVDHCGEKIAQPMFLTSNVINFNQTYPTGKFDIEELSSQNEEVFESFRVKFIRGGEYKYKEWTDEYIREWSHADRFAVAKVLANFFGDDIESARSLYHSICGKIHERYPKYSENRLKSMFDAQYPYIVGEMKRETSSGVTAGIYTSLSRNALRFCRKVFGIDWKANNVFIPSQVVNRTYDMTFDLEEGEYMSSIFNKIISSSVYDFIHIEAGCGLGKTRALIEYVKSNPDKRVCFVAPMTSVSRNNFDGNDGWIIVDSQHRGAYKNIDDGSRRSVCTTWDSFIYQGMDQKDFDLYVFDEAHALYLYDYRAEIATSVISSLKSMREKKVVLMTGTPSVEMNIRSDVTKVKVSKNVVRNKCEIVAYNDSFKGWLFADIKQWLEASSDNMAVAMYDYVCATTVESFNLRGFTVDVVYNKRFNRDVKKMDAQKTLSGRLTLISVYGQAGINIYAPEGKKVRLYIINECALSIIQYANRIRNRECIESVKVLYKKENITNSVQPVGEPDYVGVKRRIEEANESHRNYPEWILRSKFGIDSSYVFRTNTDKYVLRESVFDTFERCKEVTKYESQMQLVYNRLRDASYDVEVVQLDEDKEDEYISRLSGSVGSVIETGRVLNCLVFKNGKYYFDNKLDETVCKYMTDKAEKDMKFIANFLYNEYSVMNSDKKSEYKTATDYIREMYSTFVREMSESSSRKSVGKCDLSAWSDMCELKRMLKNPEDIGDEVILFYLKKYMDERKIDNSSIIRLTAAHVGLYITGKASQSELYRIADETYSDMKRLVRNIGRFKWFIDIDGVSRKTNKRENDPEVRKRISLIERYLKGKHVNKKAGKGVKCYKFSAEIPDGVLEAEFPSKSKAAEFFRVDEKSIRRWLKNGGIFVSVGGVLRKFIEF